MKLSRLALAVIVAMLAIAAGVAVGATTGLVGTPQTLACAQTYTATYDLSGPSGSVDHYSNVYTTPACPVTVTQTTVQTVTQTLTATTPTTTTTASSSPQPNGPAGTWTLAFDDEFNGTALNTTNWSTHDGWTNQNGVTDHASNISETGGDLILNLPSSTSGAAVESTSATLSVGQVAEASVNFPGTGSYADDWNAWWVSGPNWPAAGENDIAEGNGNAIKVNYHSPTVNGQEAQPSGTWAGGFHTYTIERFATYSIVWYDGTQVAKYNTADNGAPENLIFTTGYSGGTFTAAQIKVNYVRVWSAA